MATHYDIVSVDSVPSTQDVASTLFAASDTPTLVVADRQTQGRGRQGRSWEEPGRGLYSSLAFETGWPSGDRAVVTLCTAVAVAASIEEVTGSVCALKWPNDILVAGRKVGGILVEATGDVVVIGCGVNLWWPEPPKFAGAVFEKDPGKDVATVIARGWVRRLLGMIDDGPDGWPRSEYLQRSWTVGRVVTWDGGTGTAVGIAPGGGLIVDTDDGEKTITAGEVHVRQER